LSFLTDTHSHLYGEQFDHDRAAVIARAAEAGVQYHFLPNVDLESVPQLVQTVQSFPDVCFPMLGLHPCSVKDDYLPVLEKIREHIDNAGMLLGKPICAIGEIGLDFYWDVTHKSEQFDALEKQIGWALEMELPVVLHTRKSVQETIEVVKQLHSGNLSGVFHCFGGSVQEAERIISMDNFYLGIGGVVTYKNAGMAEVVTNIPLEYLILETDAPYLTPVPHRGKRNEPAYVRLVAEKVAALKGISLEEVMTVTSENAGKLYKVNLGG
jgi:TatD DNase family protein